MNTWLKQLDRQFSLHLNLDQLSQQSEHTIFETLRHHPDLSESDLLQTCARLFGQEIATPSQLYPTPCLNDNDTKHCQNHRIVPLYLDQEGFGLAIDNPFNPHLKTLKQMYPKQDHYYLSQHDLDQLLQAKPNDTLSQIISHAIQVKASDIHFCESQEHYKVAFRIHGQYHMMPEHKVSHKRQINNQIKFLAGINISHKQHAQDGQIRWTKQQHPINIRVATMPTTDGEDIVFRLFHQEQKDLHINDIGLNSAALIPLKKHLQKPHGLILVTGATGSGKTSTLYAAISYIYHHFRKQIISLEDPVEVQLNGIRQSQVSPETGYGFQEGLKAALRQDPDVIVVGEIRDAGSAQTALAAAYTGHLVLASLHTNSVENTLKRLESFNCDPFMVEQTLLAICSQQLHPINCKQCHGDGCQDCRYTGISHRQLIVEYKDGSSYYKDPLFN